MTIRPVLWNVVRAANADESALRRLLEPASQEQLIHLHRKLDEAASELYLDTRFIAHVDPSALTRKAPDAPDFPAVIAALYRERFDDDIPDHEPDPANDPSLQYESSWDEKLWGVADLVAEGIPIEEALTGYTRSDLVRLDLALQAIVERLRVKANEALGKDASGMGWREWTEWIVGHGKAKVDRYFANPAKAPRQVPDDAEMTTLTAQLDAEYHARFGEHMPAIAADA